MVWRRRGAIAALRFGHSGRRDRLASGRELGRWPSPGTPALIWVEETPREAWLFFELAPPIRWEPNGIEIRRRVPPPQPKRLVRFPLAGEGTVDAFIAAPSRGAPFAGAGGLRTEGGKLWWAAGADAPAVALLDPAPPPGHATLASFDEAQVALLDPSPDGTAAQWLVFDARSGAQLGAVPRDRCGSTPRRVGERLVCERTRDGRQEMLGLDARTLEERWRHEVRALPLPMPSPYGAGG